MKNTLDFITVQQARDKLKHLKANKNVQAFLEAAEETQPDFVLTFVGVSKRFGDIISETAGTQDFRGILELNKRSGVSDFFVLGKITERRFLESVCKVASEDNLIKTTSRLKALVRKGFVRVLNKKEAEEILLPLYIQQRENGEELFRRDVDSLLMNKDFFKHRPEEWAREGNPAILWLHHVGKHAITRVAEIVFDEGKQERIQPHVFNEMPGYFDLFLPFIIPIPQEKIERIANYFKVDIWHPAIEEEKAGEAKITPIRATGYMQIYDKESAIENMRRKLEKEKIAENIPNRMKVIQFAQEAPDDWRLVFFYNVSALQVERIQKINPKLSVKKLDDNDSYTVTCMSGELGKMDNEQLKKIARGMGLEFYSCEEERIARTGTLVTAVHAHGRVTPEAVLEIKEQQVGLVRDFNSELIDLSVYHGMGKLAANHIFRLLGNSMKRADCVIWRGDMWKAGITGAEVFTGDTVDEEFIAKVKPQFWHLEENGMSWDLGVNLDFGFTQPMWIEFLYVTNVVLIDDDDYDAWVRKTEDAGMAKEEAVKYLEEGLMFGICFAPAGAKVGDSGRAYLPHWRFLPPLFANEPIKEYMAPVIAALKFMNLEIISKEKVQPPRAYRRQAEREKRILSDVHTIYLRRTKAAPKPEATDTEEEVERKKREYSVQFLVGGHWRNQYYPATQTHKQIYIAPYFKGDESLPFKTPNKHVYAVKR